MKASLQQQPMYCSRDHNYIIYTYNLYIIYLSFSYSCTIFIFFCTYDLYISLISHIQYTVTLILLIIFLSDKFTCAIYSRFIIYSILEYNFNLRCYTILINGELKGIF